MSHGEDKFPEELAEMAFQLEADGGNFCGRQDQWTSARGGVQPPTLHQGLGRDNALRTDEVRYGMAAQAPACRVLWNQPPFW